mgnify:CR=1 FL=1
MPVWSTLVRGDTRGHEDGFLTRPGIFRDTVRRAGEYDDRSVGYGPRDCRMATSCREHGCPAVTAGRGGVPRTAFLGV